LPASSKPAARIAARRASAGLAFGRLSGADRADHGHCVIANVLHQRREIWRGQAAIGGQMRAADHRREHGRADPRRPALQSEIGRGAIGLARMLGCRLQRAHAHLDAVVGGQPLGYQRWQQDVRLPELFNDV